MAEYVESVRAIYNDAENTLIEKIKITTNKDEYVFDIPIKMCRERYGFKTAIFSKNLKELTENIGISWKRYEKPLGFIGSRLL